MSSQSSAQEALRDPRATTWTFQDRHAQVSEGRRGQVVRRGPLSFDEMLAESFRVGLDLPADTDVTTLAFEQHPHWDSLGHMSLVVALEETFGLSLDEEDVLAIQSYASAAAVLKSKDRAGS